MSRFADLATAVTAAVLGLTVLTAAAPPPRLSLSAEQQAAVLAALEDERHAEAVYAAVLAKFGAVRPFSNIIRSERMHQARLVELLNAAGVAIPANPYAEGGKSVVAPASVAAACRVAADAEIANAALYDQDLLPRVKDSAEVTAVFKALSTASTNNHLPAFERCASGRVTGWTGGQGQGRQGGGDGQGRGSGLVPNMLRAAFSPIPW